MTLKLLEMFPPILDLKLPERPPGAEISALHSGNLGDVIYSLPTAFALGARHLILNVCSDPNFNGRIMTRDSAIALATLLIGQGSLGRVSVIQSHTPWEYADPALIGVDLILDSFRNNNAGPEYHLIHRHALAFGIRVDGARRWLNIEPCGDDLLPGGIRRPYVVVGLTGRYRRWGDDYYVALLKDVPPDRIVFVGVEGDVGHKKNIAGAYFKANDFQQFACLIAGCSLFIGNPSFPYALAEALKVPRLVELPDGINVAPLDPSGLALHVHSVASLRCRIFETIGCSPPELATMTERVEGLVREKEALEASVRELVRSNAAAHRSLQNFERSVSAAISDREELSKQIDQMHENFEQPVFLLKCLIRRLMFSTRPTAALHGSLARIAPLRRLWQSLGSA